MRTSAVGRVFSNGHSKSERVAEIDGHFGPFVERLLGKLDVTQTAAAEALGVARQTFAKSLEAGKSPRIAWLYMLPEIVRVAIAQDLVGDEYVVVKRSDIGASTSDDFGRFSRITAKAAALTSTFANSLSDGRVDIVEERELLTRYDEVIAEAQSHVHAMKQRQSGLKVVSGGGAA